MSIKDNHNLALHLTIIGFTLIIFFSSCTTTYYHKHYDYSSGEPESRYKITEKDLEEFSQTIRHRQQDPDGLYRQAIHFQRINKHKQALKVLEDALLIDTTHAKAYNAMGISYDKLGDHPRAVEAYQRALKINPENASVLNNLGYSYLLLGKTEEAIGAFRSAINQDSRNPKYHNNLATAYAQKGLFDQALKEFIVASGDAKGHYNMAQIYMKMGRPNKAQYHLARSKSPAPRINIANRSKGETKSLAVANPRVEEKQIDIPKPDQTESGTQAVINHKAEGINVIAATAEVEKKQNDLPKTKEPPLIIRKPINPIVETITVYESTPKVADKQNIPPKTDSSAPSTDNFIIYKGEPKTVIAANPRIDNKKKDPVKPGRPAPIANEAISPEKETKTVVAAPATDEKKSLDDPILAYLQKSKLALNKEQPTKVAEKSIPSHEIKLSRAAESPAHEKNSTSSVSTITYMDLPDIRLYDAGLKTEPVASEKPSASSDSAITPMRLPDIRPYDAQLVAVPSAPEKIPPFSISAIAPMRLPDIKPFHSRLKMLPVHKKNQPRTRSCRVEISNGNGVNRMARRVGEYLKRGGIQVTRLTNAKHFSFAKTTIYYHNDYIEEAFDIAQQLPGLQLMQRASGFGRPDVKIRVLIGRDLIAHHWRFTKRAHIAQR